MGVKQIKVEMFDVEELACKITGLDYDEIDADTATIEERLYDDFGCYLEQFRIIIQRLLPLIDKGESPITGKVYKGFADTEKNCWIVKGEVKS
ncbi:MAG: hypothetical protein ACRC9X_05385 [Bacteroidales bacterium]